MVILLEEYSLPLIRDQLLTYFNMNNNLRKSIWFAYID